MAPDGWAELSRMSKYTGSGTHQIHIRNCALLMGLTGYHDKTNLLCCFLHILIFALIIVT